MRLASSLSTLVLFAVVGVAACSAGKEEVDPSSEDGLTSSATWATPDWNEQRAWYRTPQGSHLIEYDVFMALEQSGSSQRFASVKNLSRLGFVYPPSGARDLTDDARLPLGVVRDDKADGTKHVGFTCAACHTGEIAVPGKNRLIVEGGQSFLDFAAFLSELEAALAATRSNGEKKARFCDKLDDAARCDERLDAARTRVAGIIARSPSTVVEGPGRIDAIGRELNEVYANQLAKEPTTDVLAPVSIPQIWDAPRLRCMQTNCVSAAPLTRNLAEVFGVFGHTEVTTEDAQLVVRSSAKLENLRKLEEALAEMPSPKWNASYLGAIDGDRRGRGKALFGQHCASCHAEPYLDKPPSGSLLVEDGNGKSITVWNVTTTDYREVGTDAAFIDVHLNRRVNDETLTLLFDQTVWRKAAEKIGMDPGNLLASPAIAVAYSAGRAYLASTGAYGFDGSVSAFLAYGAVAEEVAVTAMADRTSSSDEAAALRREYDLYRSPSSVDTGLTGYRARPLNGIALTAPFGHNGAWPTLRDMLDAPEKRPRKFVVRPRSFDPARVGLDTSPAKSGEKLFVFDASIKGNHNGGHVYGTNLDESQKEDLVEYLKSL